MQFGRFEIALRDIVASRRRIAVDRVDQVRAVQVFCFGHSFSSGCVRRLTVPESVGSGERVWKRVEFVVRQCSRLKIQLDGALPKAGRP